MPKWFSGLSNNLSSLQGSIQMPHGYLKYTTHYMAQSASKIGEKFITLVRRVVIGFYFEFSLHESTSKKEAGELYSYSVRTRQHICYGVY